MEIEKNNRINFLFEFYGSLLTKKQRNYMQLYYADDYSLGEIAENYAVSRQAVYDNIKRTVQILEDYEDKLHTYGDFLARNHQTDRLLAYVKKTYPEDEELRQLIDNLESIEAE
ncbi:putative DNA-binding protein [Pediococcus siamensis]|uniref:putative DNA-binding protein n=1 Tax=Pediococcus siamensis TaxID=381829 RepID=UPI00399EFEE4